MRVIDRLHSGSSTDRRERLLWELALPLAVVVPAYVLVPFTSLGALVYLGVVMLPIGIAGGILGHDRRSENVMAKGILGDGDAAHGDNDAKIGPGNRLTDFASSVGLLALGSFVLIVILFV